MLGICIVTEFARVSEAWSQQATPTPSAKINAIPTATPGLNATEKKSLMSEFLRAQSNEEKAFQHTSRSEIKELGAAQSLRIRNWQETERRLRKDFFDLHALGTERRQYVQDYLKRKKEFDAAVKTENENSKKSWADKAELLKKKQKEQMSHFKEQLEQGKRPDPSLWPN